MFRHGAFLVENLGGILMKIARLRHRVTLLRPIRAPDEYGGARLEYEEVTATWADFLRPNFGHQNMQGDGDSR